MATPVQASSANERSSFDTDGECAEAGGGNENLLPATPDQI